MPYLQRRIAQLLDDIKAGTTHITVDDPDLIADIRSVSKDENGLPLLGTCSEKVRALARSYYLIRDHLDSASNSTQGARMSPSAAPTDQEITEYNRELFGHFERLFTAFAGCNVNEFCRSGEEFGVAVRRLGLSMTDAPNRQRKMERAFNDAVSDLMSFYSQRKTFGLDAARSTGGLKLILGGQRFTGASGDAVRSMLLYSDRIMIPDPVLPWLETARKEERFRHVSMVQNAYRLLKFKPLVDADLNECPLLVFPSWEKTLESQCDRTNDGIERLILDFLSHFMKARFDDISEVPKWLSRHSDEFLDSVNRNKLFIPMEGNFNQTLKESIAQQRVEIRRWRSEDHCRQINELPDEAFVFNAICERLVPVFHLYDNADHIGASALFSIPVHWHYFALSQRATRAAFLSDGSLTSGSSRIVEALCDSRFKWLGNVPIEALVEMRANNENEPFRRKLDQYVNELKSADMDCLDKISAQVAHGISALIQQHQRDVSLIADKYQQKYIKTAVAGWATLAASFLPWFPALVPLAASAVAVKYLSDKAAEWLEKRQKGRTMLGVLSSAARSD